MIVWLLALFSVGNVVRHLSYVRGEVSVRNVMKLLCKGHYVAVSVVQCWEHSKASLLEAAEHRAPASRLLPSPPVLPARRPAARRQYAPGCVGARVRRSPLAVSLLPTLIDWILAHLCGCLSPSRPGLHISVCGGTVAAPSRRSIVSRACGKVVGLVF